MEGEDEEEQLEKGYAFLCKFIQERQVNAILPVFYPHLPTNSNRVFTGWALDVHEQNPGPDNVSSAMPYSAGSKPHTLHLGG
jgi:hypothetical protein